MLIRADQGEVALVQLAAFRYLYLQGRERNPSGIGGLRYGAGIVVAVEMKRGKSRSQMIEQRAAVGKEQMRGPAAGTGGWPVGRRIV